MKKREWAIGATVSNRFIKWSYDDLGDARRAWRHMERKRETIDTSDPITAASIRMPNGLIYYLGESGLRWN